LRGSCIPAPRQEPQDANRSLGQCFLTGHELVDHQHQELFKMVNELHDAIVGGKGTDVLAPTLKKLANYTVNHFRDEEALMQSINYPALPAHHKKHEDLTKQVTNLMAKFDDGKMVLSITLSSFLADWLRHHIKEDDAALIKYLKEHPLKGQAATASK
jgi:hemerythrin